MEFCELCLLSNTSDVHYCHFDVMFVKDASVLLFSESECDASLFRDHSVQHVQLSLISVVTSYSTVSWITPQLCGFFHSRDGNHASALLLDEWHSHWNSHINELLSSLCFAAALEVHTGRVRLGHDFHNSAADRQRVPLFWGRKAVQKSVWRDGGPLQLTVQR